MNYSVTCDHAGCGFVVRHPERRVAGTWLYRHLITAHGVSMAELSLEEVCARPKFDAKDTGPEAGMPWRADASELPGRGRRAPF